MKNSGLPTGTGSNDRKIIKDMITIFPGKITKIDLFSELLAL